MIWQFACIALVLRWSGLQLKNSTFFFSSSLNSQRHKWLLTDHIANFLPLIVKDFQTNFTVMQVSRRKFLRDSASMIAGYWAFANASFERHPRIMTVKGGIDSGRMGFTLSHEHILVDFIGADKIDPSRYAVNEVFDIALQKLTSVRQKGCSTLVECTPAWLGRDVKLLKRLSAASGMHILTNTGWYGAAGEKYLPAPAFTETADKIAARWIGEWENGIEGTGIKPGFIKSGVDKYPLSAVQQKIVEAAAITHASTGLTIAVHTGDGRAAMEELRIIQARGIHPEAWIWVHAQNETDRGMHFHAASAGGWISFDGVNAGSVPACVKFLKDMKREGLLKQVLVSQDSGWYHVGEPGGGNFNDYNAIADKLLPAMREHEFTTDDLQLIFNTNPSKAFTIKIRKK